MHTVTYALVTHLTLLRIYTLVKLVSQAMHFNTHIKQLASCTLEMNAHMQVHSIL